MMKYITIAAATTALSSSVAIAGGISEPVFEAVPQVAYAAPAATGWTGAYIGGNLNYGKGKLNSSGALAAGLAGAGYPTSAAPDGASGALRAGYDWQRGAGVFGLGAEYNFGKYKDTLNSVIPFSPAIDTEIKEAATVFARAGYAMNDNLMAYGLAGYTWAKGTVSVGGVALPSQDLSGGTLGLGAEYKFSPNMSTYAEYTYTDFGTVKNTGNQLKATLGQVKLGLNYRF